MAILVNLITTSTSTGMSSHCLIRYETDPPPVPEHRTRAQTEGNPLGTSTPPMPRRQEPSGTPGTPVSVRVSTVNITHVHGT